MKSVTIFLFCVIFSSALTQKTRYHRTAPVDVHAQIIKYDVDDLIDHYNQIDMAPFVDTTRAKRQAEKSIVNTAVLLSQEGKFEDAKRLLDGVKVNNVIVSIVERSYDGHFRNTAKTIDFIKSMTKASDQMKGFSALYDVMKRNQDMANPAIIEIAYWMQHHLNDADVKLETDEYPERFLYYDIEEHSIVADAIERLANQLKGGNTEDIEFLAKKYPGAFTVVIPKLVNAVYNRDEKNFNLAMTLAENKGLSPTLKEKILDELLEAMHFHNHLVGFHFDLLKNAILGGPTNAMRNLRKKVLNLTRGN